MTDRPTILAVAATANAAAVAYREADSFRAMFTAAAALVAATDELTSAVADAVATGEPTLCHHL